MQLKVEERRGEHVVSLYASGADGEEASWTYKTSYSTALEAYRIKRTFEELIDQGLPINLEDWITIG